MTGYNELRDGQEFYGNGYKQGYSDAKLKYNKGEKGMKDKIKQAVADEFKYRARQGRPIYTMEEVIYIVNEVIDEVNVDETEAMPQDQSSDVDMQILIIKGDLQHLAEKVDKLSSIVREVVHKEVN